MEQKTGCIVWIDLNSPTSDPPHHPSPLIPHPSLIPLHTQQLHMKILMVCLGNICRSPLAEGIMRHHIEQNNLPWEVDSAGTGGWHAGEQPDRRSIATAAKHGIDIRGQRARRFEPDDFDRFDHILVMDTQNLRDVLRQAPNAAAKEKVRLILDVLSPGQGHIVPDPYYDDDGFEPVFQMLDAACAQFVYNVNV